MVDMARFVQTPGVIAILYQGTTNSVHRTVFTDEIELDVRGIPVTVLATDLP